MKRIFTMLVIIGFVLSMTCIGIGCKQEAVPEEEAVEEEAAEESVEEETAEESAEEEVLPAMDLHVWDWQPGENYINAMAENIELFKQMNPKYKNVNIVHTVNGKDYWTVLRATLFAGGEDIPDCFGIMQQYPDLYDFMTDMRPIISSDEEWMEQYGNDYLESPDTSTSELDDRVTGIAIDRWVAGVIYYKDMLEKYGLDSPVTVDDYVAMEPVLAADGIEVLSMGGDQWVTAFLFWNMVQAQTEITNPAGVVRDFFFGDIKFTDPIWRNALEGIKKLYDGGVFREDELQLGQYAEAIQNFQNRKSLGFWIGATWWAGSMNEEDLAAGNIGFMPAPVVEGGEPTVLHSVGQTYGMYISIPEEKKQVATDFLKFLSSPEAVEVYFNNNILPAAAVPEGTEIQNSLIKYMLETDATTRGFDGHAWEGASMTQHGDLITNVCLGITTIDEAVAEMQAAQDAWLSE
jgi:raffinose/stachyose/melibiose transport system substrate-binding protein